MDVLVKICVSVLCLSLLSGCSELRGHKIAGEINSEFVVALERVPEGESVIIASLGGDPNFAEVAAKIIQDRQLHVSITDYCLSSCVEYLLIAAESVRFTNAPIIGLHQNPSLINDLKNEDETYADRPLCYFEDNLDYYVNLHTQNRTAPFSNAHVLERVQIVDTRLRETDHCVEVGFEFENQMWLPTREQLQDLWGLEVYGSVCADSFEACALKIDRYLPKGSRVVIGDEVYISKGT